MNVSPAGVTLIKEFEGFPHGGRPYRDMVGVWTIGYGHTEGVGPNSSPISEKQASELLRRDLDKKYGPAIDGLGLKLGQHQYDALVSFVYNCGPGAVSPKTPVGRALRRQDWKGAANCLLMWDKAGGRSVLGLTRRRTAERALFLDSEDDDPLQDYTDNERKWIREYDKLVRSNGDPARRRALRELMTAQRKRIWRAAQPKAQGGDGQGWEHGARRARYRSLKARTQD
jgi:GH24 family phage-related lysozyme (muramidase)